MSKKITFRIVVDVCGDAQVHNVDCDSYGFSLDTKIYEFKLGTAMVFEVPRKNLIFIERMSAL
jgi:hypothetical protein